MFVFNYMSADHSLLNALAAELGEEAVLQMAISYINAVRERREGIAPAAWSVVRSTARPAFRQRSNGSIETTPPLRGVSWADRSAWFRRLRGRRNTRDDEGEDDEMRAYLEQHANVVFD